MLERVRGRISAGATRRGRRLLEGAMRVGWRATVRYGPRCRLRDAPSLTCILLSYRRPENMADLVRGLLRCEFVDRVIVSNSNPETEIGRWTPFSDPRLQVTDAGRHTPAGFRFELAREAEAAHYLCIDDDVFLRPKQIRDLYAHYLEDPSVPHGVWGHDFSEAEGGLKRRRVEASVDVLQQVYLLSRQHVTDYFRLLGELGFRSTEELRFGDDILLGHCSEGRPRCHDVGLYAVCPTTHAPGRATWKQSGFEDFRIDLLSKVRELRPRGASADREATRRDGPDRAH